MTRAAIALWREMPIAVTFTIVALACVVSARDIVLDDTASVVEVSTNEKLSLICGLKAKNQIPTVRWFLDGKPLEGQARQRMMQQKQWLRIKSFRAKDAGVYTCQNEEDKSREMIVTIKHKPDLGPYNVDEYQSDVDVLRPMSEILSQHSARLLENNTKNEKEHLNYGHDDDTKSKYAPKFKHPSKLFNMDMKPAGSSIRLKCAAEGYPMPNITWYKNNVTPISRRFLKPYYGKWSITLEELTKADNGNYTCKICNELG